MYVSVFGRCEKVMILDELKESLKRMAADTEVPMNGVYYGACQDKDISEWNYFVFNRDVTKKTSNRCDFQTYYEVHIIHEDYIPENYVAKVIKNIESEVLLKCTPQDIIYNYTFKGKTNMVVEIATIQFVKPEKRC